MFSNQKHRKCGVFDLFKVAINHTLKKHKKQRFSLP